MKKIGLTKNTIVRDALRSVNRSYRLMIVFAVTVVLIACQQAVEPTETASADCRMVQHALGETCVPLVPQRVVALSAPTVADAIALGVQPVGMAVYYDQAPAYLESQLKEVERVGDDNQPSLEAILSIDPDLIVGLQYSAESIYDQLSQISPTVLDDWSGYPSWKEHFNFIAEVLGKETEGEQVWANYDQRIEELRSALGSRYQDVEISFVRVCCNNWATDVKNSFSGMILEDAGLSRPPAQAIEDDDGMVKLSEEALTQFDGDIIFLVVEGGQDSLEAVEQLKQKPIWQNLKAVQSGKVYPVDFAAWRGGNPLAADVVIDDLFKYLVEEPA